jgi:hypothetical protein
MSDKENSEEEVKAVPTQDTKLKKESSYTYWVNNDPNFFKDGLKPDIKPKPVDVTSLPQPVEVKDNGKHEHSAWNTAGTWEEKHLDIAKILKVLESKLINQSIANGKAKIVKVSKCEGESKLIVSRGKKFLGYHLTIKYRVEGTEAKTEPKPQTTVTLKDFQDDGDYEADIGSEDEDQKIKDTVRSAISNVAQATYDAINTLKETL